MAVQLKRWCCFVFGCVSGLEESLHLEEDAAAAAVCQTDGVLHVALTPHPYTPSLWV